MRITNQTYYNYMNGQSRTLRMRVVKSDNTEITGDDVINFKHLETGIGEKNITVGVVSRKVTELELKTKLYVGNKLQIYIDYSTADDSDGNPIWTKSTYIIETCYVAARESTEGGTYKYTCYDFTDSLTSTFDWGNAVAMTPNAIIYKVMNKHEWTWSGGFDDVSEFDKIKDSKYTELQMLQFAVGSKGNNIKRLPNQTFKLWWYSPVPSWAKLELEHQKFNGFKGNEEVIYDGVVTGTDDNPKTYGDCANQVISFVNPFKGSGNAQTIYNRTIGSGLTVSPMEIQYNGNPCYEVGDVIQVAVNPITTYNNDGDAIVTPERYEPLYVTSIEIEFDGGLTGTIRCESESEQASSSSNSGSGTISAQLNNLNYKFAKIDSIVADQITAGEITAEVIDTKVATVAEAKISELSADFAHITDGVIDNAKIDFADINNVSIKNAQIESINGNKIEEGTIIAEALNNTAILTIKGTTVYYQATQPTTPKVGNAFVSGDTWYKTVVGTDETYASNMYVYNGTTWVETPLDGDIIRANSITAQHLNVNNLGAVSAILGDVKIGTDTDYFKADKSGLKAVVVIAKHTSVNIIINDNATSLGSYVATYPSCTTAKISNTNILSFVDRVERYTDGLKIHLNRGFSSYSEFTSVTGITTPFYNYSFVMTPYEEGAMHIFAGTTAGWKAGFNLDFDTDTVEETGIELGYDYILSKHKGNPLYSTDPPKSAKMASGLFMADVDYSNYAGSYFLARILGEKIELYKFDESDEETREQIAKVEIGFNETNDYLNIVGSPIGLGADVKTVNGSTSSYLSRFNGTTNTIGDGAYATDLRGSPITFNATSFVDLFKVVQKDSAVGSNIAAGGTATITAAVNNETGYKPIGIVGHQLLGTAGQTYMNAYRIHINGNNAECRVRNVGTTAVTGPYVKFYVLYIKNI